MSASLVGSEMCIRDRPKTLQGGKERLLFGIKNGDVHVNWRFRTAGARVDDGSAGGRARGRVAAGFRAARAPGGGPYGWPEHGHRISRRAQGASTTRPRRRRRQNQKETQAGQPSPVHNVAPKTVATFGPGKGGRGGRKWQLFSGQ
eukprot:13779817-Alexandrium_andersonii.AAC.1